MENDGRSDAREDGVNLFGGGDVTIMVRHVGEAVEVGVEVEDGDMAA